MKIMIVIPYFYPKIGGMENYALNIVKGLKNTYRWNIVVVTSANEITEYKEEIIDGMKIYRLPVWFKVSNTPVNLLWYFQLKGIINREKPDVINAHTPVPFISDVAAMTHGDIPFILTYHGDLEKENFFLNSILKLYYLILGMPTLKKADKIIATSKYYARHSKYLKAFTNKIGVVSPGVDIKKFNLSVSKTLLKKRYGNNFFVTFVGQLDKTHVHKGIEYLLEAIVLVKKEIQNIKLIVVGKGDNLQNYKNKAKYLSLNSNVVFTGFVEDKSLPEYYGGTDVVVLPTYNNSEGFGMILLEAGACGKPVIGTKVGGIPYVISNNVSGLLVPPKDPKALSEAILKIITDPKTAKQLGEKGYDRVRKYFTWKRQINKTHNIFLQTL